MIVHPFGFLCFSATLLCTPVIAAEPKPTPLPTFGIFAEAEPADAVFRVEKSADGKIIYLIGMLEPGAYKKFDRVLKTAPDVRTLYLASPGGVVMEGFLIAAVVRERKLDTYAEHVCVSSCTQIMVAGKDRAAGPAAHVGFHKSGPWFPPPGTIAPGGPANGKNDAKAADKDSDTDADDAAFSSDALFRHSFERAGVAADFVGRAFKTSNASLWAPDLKTMLDARFLTRIAKASELPPLAGVGMVRGAFELALKPESLWRQLKDKLPEVYASSVNDGVRATHSGSNEVHALLTARSVMVAKLLDRAPQAPDGIAADFALLIADQMKADRADGFKDCLAGETGHPSAKGADPVLQAREDALLAQLVDAPLSGETLSVAKAESLFRRLVARRIDWTTLEVDSPEYNCRNAADIMDIIAALPLKKRVRAFKALMVFGAMEEEAD